MNMSESKREVGPMLERFIRALQFRHIHYQFTDEDNGTSGIVVMFERDGCEPLRLFLSINEELGRFVFFAIPLLYGEDATAMTALANKATAEIPYASFVYDTERKVIYCRAYGIITVDSVAGVCMGMMGDVLVACHEFDKIAGKGVDEKALADCGQVQGVPGILS